MLGGGQYTVTQAARGVVSLMQDAMAEACRSGNPALAQALCGAVVDVAAMVAALPPPPAAGGGDAASAAAAALLPYPAALRRNDCYHVYEALCALPYQYAPRLQRLVHRAVNFVAPAARVRRAGDESLATMAAAQRGELLSVVAELGGLRGLDGPALIRCRRAAAQLLAGFRRLGAALRGVLPPAAFVATAGGLVEAVAAQICGECSMCVWVCLLSRGCGARCGVQPRRLVELPRASTHTDTRRPEPAAAPAACAARAVRR